MSASTKSRVASTAIRETGIASVNQPAATIEVARAERIMTVATIHEFGGSFQRVAVRRYARTVATVA